MPDLTFQTDALVAWLSSNGVALAIVAIVALLGYRWARPRIHRALVSLIYAQASTLGQDSARKIEIDKRIETIEDLIVKVLRAFVVFAIAAVILAAFDLWGIFSGLGLILAAITLAGQAIVLDYLMGVLILTEAQYFKGDIIRVTGIEGTVEEVGLRRTVICDTRGTVHSISNGLIRSPSNLTRSYALAVIHIDGIADADVERAIAVLDEVGQAMAADPEFGERFIEVPGYTATTKLSAYGATLKMSGRVQPEQRVRIEAEMRRRVAAGLANAGVEPIRAPGGRTPPPPDADGRPSERA